MELSTAHRDLLQAVEDLESPGHSVGTKAAGRRLLEIWQVRGVGHAWQAYAPWHGTSPWAEELREAGLLEVHPGMAQFRRWDQPAARVEQYFVSLTDAGREALEEG